MNAFFESLVGAWLAVFELGAEIETDPYPELPQLEYLQEVLTRASVVSVEQEQERIQVAIKWFKGQAYLCPTQRVLCNEWIKELEHRKQYWDKIQAVRQYFNPYEEYGNLDKFHRYERQALEEAFKYARLMWQSECVPLAPVVVGYKYKE